jgi:hypothetical protein
LFVADEVTEALDFRYRRDRTGGSDEATAAAAGVGGQM